MKTTDDGSAVPEPADDGSELPEPTEDEREYAERDATASRMSTFVHHPLLRLTMRSMVAAGLAYELGSWVPRGLGQYPYYAALGALTVMVPAVSDSVKEAMRVTSAILLGVLLAVATQAITWPNALTVGIVIGVGTVLGGIRWFGAQRAWVPLAALFVLTVQGASTDWYAVAYLVQVALGAVVALLLNFVFPPLPLHEVDIAVTRMRSLLVQQLREMVQVLTLDDLPGRELWHERLRALNTPREEMSGLAHQSQRAKIGNLRARRWDPVQVNLIEVSHALERCSWLVEDLGVVLMEFEHRDYSIFGEQLRQDSAKALAALADVLDTPERAAPGSVLQRRADEAIDALLDQVDDQQFDDRMDRYLAGAVAVTAKRCLHTYTQRHGDQ
ncbi:FUSC family protein [Segeticoccus rhizosphaerae]|uniref:FUSC family protein n=1 Tax=Segeticoccus rhizosphaerae TaxID=1104777 RepID=UPI0010C0D0F1|nr:MULTISPECIES: hypothetical protein [Intrasporangiaceae]